ncbi:MAG: formate dehydrogenase accessory protein FdhE [Xanthobacteraceae bacterium]|nr:formate dehydrogenase accessory protein FdhE [Xanthobacteraceae bacterium]
MSANIEPDPSIIGTIAKPPFVRLPDPARLFADRAARFRALASGHQLEPYLKLLAGISQAQSDVQQGLPEPRMPDTATLSRAHDHGMPPLDRNAFNPDDAFDQAFERLLARVELLEMPPQANAALVRVKAAERAARDMMIHNVLADAIPFEALAEHVFVAAALQVHFARLAAKLEEKSLADLGHGICPSCGGAPSSTMVVGWTGADGTRFCSCSLCGTLWNYIRLQCTLCGSNRKMQYQEIEGSEGVIKAEICEDCRGYVKVLYEQKNRDLEPIADDVASLGLDLMVQELGFRRGGVNPFLIGY